MSQIIYKAHQDYIEFISYPFKCSSIYKTGKLNAIDIVDTTGNFWPDVARTINGELIFIGYRQEEVGEHKKLPKFFCENNIKVREDVVDIWSFILEPFLDTEHSDEWIEKSYKILEKCGISRLECNSIREEVSDRMIAYNFQSYLWEWMELNLYDVLKASIGILSGENHRFNDEEFEKFYQRTMNIALKGFS